MHKIQFDEKGVCTFFRNPSKEGELALRYWIQTLDYDTDIKYSHLTTNESYFAVTITQL